MSLDEVTVTTLIIGFKVVTLAFGSLITYFAFKAFRRTENRSLLLLATGFGIVTLGTFLAGIVHQLLIPDFKTGLIIESALLTCGFFVIVLSLYLTQPQPRVVSVAEHIRGTVYDND